MYKIVSKFWAILLIGIILSVTSCTPVSPWQREVLSLPHMSFDPDPLEAKFVRHVYESKEGTSGGYGVAAGGCGCN